MMNQTFKIVVFDMDGTLLKERTIFVFAEKKGFIDDLLYIINNNQIKSYEKSIKIAKLLKGMDCRDLLSLFRKISLQDYTEHVIKKLKDFDIKTAIATNSYRFFANDLKNRLGIDYLFANDLVIRDNIITGELIIHNKYLNLKYDYCKQHSICKSHVLDYLCNKLRINPDEIIAVGDGEIDICMLKKAGIGIAFKAPENVQQNAYTSTDDLRSVLDYIRI